MMALVLPVLLGLGLAVAALLGPRLVRAAAPALVRIPRLAVLLLIGSLMLWLLSAAALSLLLAWMVTGPTVLPVPAAEVCQRCIDAARPFTSAATVETVIPVAVLLALPAIALSALAAVGVYRGMRRYRATRALGQDLAATTRATCVRGYSVLIVRDRRPVVFSLPRRVGGIVVSDGLLHDLEPAELDAVLAHEAAHLREHHHAIRAILAGLVWPLRWVPLVAAIADAVPHYLEIAADNAGRRTAGTTALASALLTIGDQHAHPAPPRTRHAHSSVLYAAGPERIRHLVAPTAARPALIPVTVLALQLAVLALTAVTIHGPYAYVALTGCQLPT